MNYAFMTFSCKEATLAEVLALANRFGYDGIEPRAGGGHAHGVETELGAAERTAARDAAAKAGVQFACLAVGCKFADPANSGDNVEQAHAGIDLAADIGAPVMRVFGGRLGEGLARPAAVELVAAALARLADHAAERGVTLCMETHDDWCEPADVAAVMQAVDHPAVAVNWDLMHPIRVAGKTLEQAFDTLKPWVRHTHVHDAGLDRASLDFKPMGQGVVDHAVAFGLLRSIGYAGYLSGEWIGWEPGEVHLPREIEAMKKIEATLGD